MATDKKPFLIIGTGGGGSNIPKVPVVRQYVAEAEVGIENYVETRITGHVRIEDERVLRRLALQLAEQIVADMEKVATVSIEKVEETQSYKIRVAVAVSPVRRI